MNVATGTGDFAVLAYRELQPGQLIGTDISEGMMDMGREKVRKEGPSEKVSFAEEDCTSLLSADNHFDAIAAVFDVHNFEDLDKGLSEMYHVLKPDGYLVILELIAPDRFSMKQLFSVYSEIIIPTLGKLLSKDNSAYSYLSQATEALPQGEVMKNVVSQADFSQVQFRQLTSGIRTLCMTTK